MRKGRVGVVAVALAAVAALAAVTLAGALPALNCTIEPFAYDVVDSAYDGHSGRYSYLARGTTVLTGGACPVAGVVVDIHEAGHFQGVGFFHTVTGSYDAQADVDRDGHFGDVRVNGRVTLFGVGGFGVFPQLVVVESGGTRMTLQQLAFIDLFNPHDPLLGLETTSGEIVSDGSGDGGGIIPLPNA